MDKQIKKYVNTWVKYQQIMHELEQEKKTIIDIIPESGVEVDGYRVTISERPVFSGVTLETARKFGAVHKTVNTSKLVEVLHEGKKVDGVDYTKFVTVRQSL